MKPPETPKNLGITREQAAELDRKIEEEAALLPDKPAPAPAEPPAFSYEAVMQAAAAQGLEIEGQTVAPKTEPAPMAEPDAFKVANGVRMVDILKVVIADGREADGDIDGLMASIQDCGKGEVHRGLINPITLTDTLRLVAGRNRYEACLRLGWEKIPANVLSLDAFQATIVEVDENLARKDLNVIQRGLLLQKRKRAYEALHPEVRHGGAPGKAGGGKVAKPDRSASFADDAAEKTNRSSRAVREDLRVVSKLTDTEIKRLLPHPIGRNAAELKRIGQMKDKEQRDAVVAEITAGRADNVSKAIDNIKRKARNELGARLDAEPVVMPQGPFSCLVIDPPWRYAKRAGDSTHRNRAGMEYPDMTVDEISELPVKELADEDCVVWLWTTNAFMRQAYEVLEAWGFERVPTILTWAKDKMGVGDWLRGQTEHCLMAVRGKPTVTLTNQSTLLNAQVRDHSRKPNEFYALVEGLCHGPKLEMFSREHHAGWSAWGAETEKFTSLDVAVQRADDLPSSSDDGADSATAPVTNR